VPDSSRDLCSRPDQARFLLHASCPVDGYDDPATAVFHGTESMATLLVGPNGPDHLARIQEGMRRYILPLNANPALITWWVQPLDTAR